MLFQYHIGCMISLGIMVLGADLAHSQDYPNKPVRIVTSEAGGGNDFIARLIAQELTGSLGQQIIVDNRAGVIPAQIVSRAIPDGYTLFVGSSTLWLLPFMQKVLYDPVKDFAPITLAVRSPNVLVVHPALPVKSVKDLIALAKAKPGELNYGSSSTGSPVHLGSELFNVMAGVNIVRIPYKGSGPAIIALIAGQVQLMFATAASAAPHIKSGKLRAVAVTSAQPSVLFPNLPTVAASGLPGYESVVVQGLWAPAKTPRAIINQLSHEAVRMLNKTEVKEKLLGAGVEAVGSSPEQFATTIQSEMSTMGKVIRDAGIRAD